MIHIPLFIITLLPLTYVRPSRAATTFNLERSYIGSDFWDGFTWFTDNDPTNGRVNYVDQATAMATNLSFASADKFVMRADGTNIVPASARGRNSVRIKSHDAFEDSVVVLDLSHMPKGCGTWPAFWSLSAAGPWPNGGEIDIIEGVNLQGGNIASLHTTPGCAMPPTTQQTGSSLSSDCDAFLSGNPGCNTAFSNPRSYGHPFNLDAGGWYVMMRHRSEGISVWYWSRDDPDVPSEVSQCDGSVTPSSSWGAPDAHFPLDQCDYEAHFDAHNLIFDLTLCGDWAGSTFSGGSCGVTSCNDFVDNNPNEFYNAYWEINSLHVYLP